ncbi:MAG TPA: hypothetical protein PKN36_04950 [bacterium]|nr:hypothetical protein [bacterium]
MKARLIPVYFKSAADEDFRKQLETLKQLLCCEAEFLKPVKLGSPMHGGDAAVFPQLLGEAYRRIEDFKKMKIPIMAITSEFGTMAMWDWEIVSFMKTEGIEILSPYNSCHTKILCKCLGVKGALRKVKFLVIQDDPGEGFQPEIFKRFFWWEDICTKRIKQKFGVTVVKKSFKEFGRKAKNIPDKHAEEVCGKWDIKTEGVDKKALYSAIKVYIAAREEVEKDSSIEGMGINCLNESRFSNTTPCLAWDMLFREKNIVWGCEADTLSLMTKYLAHRCLNAPIMMTNIYPSLMGMAPLKHEHIDFFPDVKDPDNCILLAHCGYLGIVPSSQAEEWTLRKKVLAIVDNNATAIDARMPMGPVTMAKLGPSMDKMLVADCSLEKYVQYPGSHCLNGAVLRVKDGHSIMKNASSHHQCLLTGKWINEIELMGKIFRIDTEMI